MLSFWERTLQPTQSKINRSETRSRQMKTDARLKGLISDSRLISPERNEVPD
jgi:hypothetical protein